MNGDGSGAAGPPIAEAFRQGHEPNVRYGYQCLTCNDEWYVPDAGHAEAGAKVHNDLHARPDSEPTS